jgi:hypothetical protein
MYIPSKRAGFEVQSYILPLKEISSCCEVMSETTGAFFPSSNCSSFSKIFIIINILLPTLYQFFKNIGHDCGNTILLGLIVTSQLFLLELTITSW